MMKKRIIFSLIFLLCFAVLQPLSTKGAEISEIDTGIKKEVYAEGQYINWDGVSTVAQFTDEKGNLCFAYVSGKKIVVEKTNNKKVTKTLKLKMKGSLFGTVVCDEDGYLYAVTGEANDLSERNRHTMFITKYTKEGKPKKSVGDNGRSSLGDWYDDSFNTQTPFASGTCDAAVNGDYLAVFYGRHMYSGHQSCSVWMINRKTLKTVKPNLDTYTGYSFYESHSFGQRVIPYAGGFAYMSEGDCFDRTFTFGTADLEANTSTEVPIFDFWVEKGAYDKYDMYLVNNNFAHIGNLCPLNNGNISFVASSVKAMNEKAEKQREQIFIQIFNPLEDLSSSKAYVTKGKREGIAGNNGDEEKVNYGVKWLTNYKSGSIENPQAVTDGKGNTIILFERYQITEKDYYGFKYQEKQFLGTYSIIVNSKGKVTQKAARISKTAHLNSCETPIYSKGNVYWCGNKEGDSSKKLYIFKY